MEEKDAAWIAKLLDLEMANIVGRVVDCPPTLSTGCDIMLSIRVEIHDSAFQSIEPEVHHSATPEPANKRARSGSVESASSATMKKGKGKEPGFYAELKENEQEKRLRERKVSLNRLFDAVGLRPVASSTLLKSQKKENRTSTRDILEHFDGPAEKAIKANDAKGKGKAKAEDGEEELEGEELDKKVVSAVYAKATRNDLHLPCVSLYLCSLTDPGAARRTRQKASNCLCERIKSRLCSASAYPHFDVSDEERRTAG